uniref:Integrase core domain-containing protein n=1 Tax=Poecilia formosa TaxID=48698 RepID=A0A096LQX8_POEFO
ILDMLRTNHDVSLSMRSLKSHLKEGLHRRGNYSPLPEVRRAIMTELRGPGQLFGYWTMWQVLKQKHNLRVKRDVVMRLRETAVEEELEDRQRRKNLRKSYHYMGPNYIWHVDGYDKLKPFGLAISGCIDGFSRRMMWLVCGSTNNNPSIIAQHYINCVKSLGVIPMRLRTDPGTENGTVAAIQCTLRHAHTDYYAGSSSHSYGSSTGNQRIESWWSFFRRGR